MDEKTLVIRSRPARTARGARDDAPSWVSWVSRLGLGWVGGAANGERRQDGAQVRDRVGVVLDAVEVVDVVAVVEQDLHVLQITQLQEDN